MKRRATPLSEVDAVAKRRKGYRYSQMVKAIDGLEDVPCMVRAMLIDMLPSCFGIPPAQRHRFQNGVVDMISGVLVDVETDLKAQIDIESGKADNAEKEQERREKASSSAQESLEAKQSSTAQSKTLLAESARKFKGAKSSVAEATSCAESCDEELKAAAKQRVELDTLNCFELKPLCDGTTPQENISQIVSNVVSALRKFDISDSILLAVPHALALAPSSRGQFDDVVIAQLREEVQKKLTCVETMLTNGQAIRAERVKALEEAQFAFSAAKDGQKACSKVFLSAQAAEEEHDQLCMSARQHLRDLGPEMKKVAKASEQLQKKLAKFKEGPLATFTSLRDGTEDEATPEVDDNCTAASPRKNPEEEDRSELECPKSIAQSGDAIAATADVLAAGA